MKIDVKGVIVPNDYADVYAFLGMDHCCPRMVQEALGKTSPGEKVDVYINSPGGNVADGSEIYEAIRSYAGPKEMHIVGQANSAASIVAMAGPSEIAPTALMMIHRISTGVHGNAYAMHKAEKMLETADNGLCAAYMEKTGMSREEVLSLMDKESWFNAEDCVRLKLVDKISERKTEPAAQMIASGEPLLSQDVINIVRKQMENQQPKAAAQAALDLLKMKGVAND